MSPAPVQLRNHQQAACVTSSVFTCTAAFICFYLHSISAVVTPLGTRQDSCMLPCSMTHPCGVGKAAVSYPLAVFSLVCSAHARYLAPCLIAPPNPCLAVLPATHYCTSPNPGSVSLQFVRYLLSAGSQSTQLCSIHCPGHTIRNGKRATIKTPLTHPARSPLVL